MALDDFAAFVRGALFLDQPDPVAAWGGLRAFQERLIEPPARRARAAPRGRGHRPDAQRRRAARGSTPTASATCPAARSSPARTSTAPNGRVRFTVRSRARRASTSTASSSSCATARSSPRAPTSATSYLQRALATDDGARRLGEIGIGTNFGIDRARPARSSSTRRSAAPCTSRSGAPIRRRAARTSRALHWDLICDLRAGGRLSADGEVVQQDGRFSLQPG